MRTTLAFVSTILLTSAALVSAPLAQDSQVEAKIDAIKQKYQSGWNAIKSESDALQADAPKGFEIPTGIDIRVGMKRHEYSLHVPEVTMKRQDMSLHLPQVTVRDRRFSWDVPEMRMERWKCGEHPEWHGPFKVVWKPNWCEQPKMHMVRREAVVGVPEFRWDETRVSLHLPEVTMRLHKIIFDVPEIRVDDVKDVSDRIKARSNDIQARAAALSDKQSREIKSVVLEDLVGKRLQLTKSFDNALSSLGTAIKSVTDNGLDPARVRQADGTFMNLNEQVERLQKQKYTELEKLDAAIRSLQA
jgi:hypothetical protein